MSVLTEFDTKSRPARASVIMVVLTVFSALTTLYGWFQSTDVRGWWPVILLLWFLVTWVYAVAYALFVNHHRLIQPSFLIQYHAALGAVLFVNTYLHYMIDIDWAAVNSGLAQLSVIQEIVTSHKTFYAIHLLFLGAAVIWSYAGRRIGGSAHS
jgi:hypothetical protein